MVKCRVDKRARSHGFSVLEFAVVIGVFGAAMALALKGTAMVDVARAFAASYDVRYFQSRMLYYAGAFKYLPGDDPKAAARYNHPPAVRFVSGAAVSDIGDSKIDGKFLDLDNPVGENIMFWRDMRFAKMLDGDPNLEGPAAMPRNPFGGVYGVDEGNLGQKKGSLCLNKVPGGAVERLIQYLSRSGEETTEVAATSQPDTGPAMGHYDEPEPPPYNVEKTYIVCAPLPR